MRRQEIYISSACLLHFCAEVTRSETTFPSLSLFLMCVCVCLSLCADKSGFPWTAADRGDKQTESKWDLKRSCSGGFCVGAQMGKRCQKWLFTADADERLRNEGWPLLVIRTKHTLTERKKAHLNCTLIKSGLYSAVL